MICTLPLQDSTIIQKTGIRKALSHELHPASCILPHLHQRAGTAQIAMHRSIGTTCLPVHLALSLSAFSGLWAHALHGVVAYLCIPRCM